MNALQARKQERVAKKRVAKDSVAENADVVSANHTAAGRDRSRLCRLHEELAVFPAQLLADLPSPSVLRLRVTALPGVEVQLLTANAAPQPAENYRSRCTSSVSSSRVPATDGATTGAADHVQGAHLPGGDPAATHEDDMNQAAEQAAEIDTSRTYPVVHFDGSEVRALVAAAEQERFQAADFLDWCKRKQQDARQRLTLESALHGFVSQVPRQQDSGMPASDVDTFAGSESEARHPATRVRRPPNYLALDENVEPLSIAELLRQLDASALDLTLCEPPNSAAIAAAA